jgi:para-nitrobenzyl esterase
MRLAIILSSLLAVAGHVVYAQTERCAPGVGIACTSAGGMRGVVADGVISYRGIPYAQPPTGLRRWRPPVPLESWSGIRDVSRFGPMCPQVAGNEVVGDEDCLTLNVWVPGARNEQSLPVMVYLTGGGNHAQSGQAGGGANFVGTRLTKEGIILVTVNIRLGALGFLTHRALDAESERHISGNYGSQDHVLMLRWVNRNIEAFGGDPNRVFLFGTSAGGANICGLLTSPLARGLFHGVVMESSVPTGCEYSTREQAQSGTGARLVKALSCERGPDVATCLREKTARDIVRAVPAVTNLFPRTYGPVVDGHVFPEQPMKRLTEGQVAKVPVIMGNNLEEAASWVDALGPIQNADQYRDGLSRVFGKDLGDRVVAEYPVARYASPRGALIRAATDGLFTCMTRRVTRALVASGAGPVYQYLFTHRLEHSRDGAVGHSIEMPFIFQSWTGYTPGSSDITVSERMVQYWTQFAKTGNPDPSNGWRAVSRVASPYMNLNERFEMKTDQADSHCEFWASVRLPSPHL